MKDRASIIFAIIGIIIRFLLFGTEYESTIKSILVGETTGAAYLKFYIAPIITYVIIFLSIFMNKKNISLISVFIGFALVFFGGRSAGGILFTTGIFTYTIAFANIKKNKKILIRIFISSLFFLYASYCLYVYQIQNGNITSGNSLQLKKIENPYNPLNIFIIGRSEIFVGARAFIDKPIFGHGAWAKDTTGKYRKLLLEIQQADENIYIEKEFIPSHSVLIGMGMQNGIFAFFLTGYIIYFFLKKGLWIIDKYNKFLFLILFFIIEMIWHSLFSPVTHFRISLPLYFSFILSTYYSKIKRQKLKLYELKNFSTYTNFRK